MQNLLWSSRGRYALGVCLASVLALLVGESRVSAQQGKYITQASARLSDLVDKANQDGYKLQNNTFSVGGGWLKKSNAWVVIYSTQLTAGKKYRVLASGDNDAKDVDLRILDAQGAEVAIDDATSADAVVEYSPNASGRYTVQIRLFASRNNLDAVCLSVLTVK